MKHPKSSYVPWGLLVVVALIGTACAPASTTSTTATGEPTSTEAPTQTPTTDSTDTTSDVAEGDFDWRAFEGSTVRVLSVEFLWSNLVQERLAEFEELTGISVEFESLPEAQFFERAQIRLSGAGDLDVFTNHRQLQAPTYAAEGYYEDLGQYVDNPELTSSEYMFDDIPPDLVTVNEIDGVLTALPINVAYQLLFYRQDLLEEFDLAVPTTLEELETAAQTIHGHEGVAGFVARGRGGAAVPMMSAFVYNMGGTWFDDEWNPVFTTEESRAGFELYARLLRDYGPPGVVNYSWEEALPLFSQGGAAFYADGSPQIAAMIDPEQSAIVENVGVAPMPAGPGGDNAVYNAWNIAMASSSENKDAAWYFIQWVTSPSVMQEFHVQGFPSPRQSVEHGDEVPEEWRNAHDESLRRPNLPYNLGAPVGVSSQAIVEAIGVALVEGIQGGDVGSALERAAEEVRQIIGN